LCFHLDKIITANLQGQIAHIDRNRANHDPGNLAYLCIPHHDAYDSTTSQSKGLTPDELRYAKKALIEHERRESLGDEEVVRLTLTVEAALESYTAEEQQQLLESLLPSLVRTAAVGIAQARDGKVRGNH
jgi:hypothetical protein